MRRTWSWEAALVWSLLVLSLPAHIRQPLGASGREIGLSLFDPALALIFAWYAWGGRIDLSSPVLRIAAAVSVLVIAHSAAFLVLDRNVQASGLARETLKYLGFVWLLGMATLLLRVPELRVPPLWAVAAALAVIGTLVIEPRIADRFAWTAMPSQSAQHANAVVGVFVVLLAAGTGSAARGRSVAVALLGVAVFGIAIELFAKGMAAVMLATGVFLALQRILARFGVMRRFAPIGLALAAVVVAAIFIILAFDVMRLGIDFPGNVARSLAIRIALWHRAGALLIEHFPWGIGLGQFGAQPHPIIDSFGAAQLLVHDTPLAMATEMGALGIALAAGFGAVVWRALRSLPSGVAVAAALYLAVSFLLSDGFGFRASFLVLAIGLAASFADRDCSSSAPRRR